MQKLACTEEILHSTFVYKTDADTVFWRDNVFGRAGIGGLSGRKWRHTRTVPRAAGSINNRWYDKTKDVITSISQYNCRLNMFVFDTKGIILQLWIPQK